MERLKKSLVLLYIVLPILRFKIALRLLGIYTMLVLRWPVRSHEHTNYTYRLTEQNLRELAHFINTILGADVSETKHFIDELLSDSGLRQHIAQRTKASPYSFYADKDARYGRRIGWYAMVRTTKPSVVIESGLDKGLGTCVLAAALLRNEQEGYPGTLYAIDIDPNAGWIVAPPYDRVINFIISDSHDALLNLSDSVDVFIHDSNHAYSHEAGEYTIIRDKMTPGGLILSDNAHGGTALMDFAENNGSKFFFWHESPKMHFYPGGGIGAILTNWHT